MLLQHLCLWRSRRCLCSSAAARPDAFRSLLFPLLLAVLAVEWCVEPDIISNKYFIIVGAAREHMAAGIENKVAF